MDVDGVLTDGTLSIDEYGGEQKRFDVSDGLGLVALRLSGLKLVWISGRKHAGVEKRAADLRIDVLEQGVKDKAGMLNELSHRTEVPLANIAFIGDDWNDLPALQIVGCPIAVANAAIEVQRCAAYITARGGGNGAVREVCEVILDAQGLRAHAIGLYLSELRETEG